MKTTNTIRTGGQSVNGHVSKATVFYLFVLHQKNPKYNEEGGKKKHLRKKHIQPFFGKVNEGDQIKKTFDKFLEKIMRATK